MVGDINYESKKVRKCPVGSENPIAIKEQIGVNPPCTGLILIVT